MSAARNLLDELAGIGATLEPDGQQLILRAGPNPVPAALVRRLREAKSDLIAALATRSPQSDTGLETSARSVPSHVDTDVAFSMRVIRCLNQHPSPSEPGRCAWCGEAELTGAVVLPFGTEPGTHTWLHSECWPAWSRARYDEAALKLNVLDNAARP